MFRDGLTIAARQKGVVALLWSATVLFAALTAWPAWSWWDRATYLPASDGLLERFSLGVFGELMQDGGSSAFGVLLATASSVLFVVPLSNALLSGGLLEILLSRDARPLFHRFFRGAGHFFWRFTRLMILSGVAMLIIAAAVGALVARLLRPLSESGWEPGWVVAALANATLVGVVVAYLLLVLDYSRVRVAAEDTHRTFRAWLGSFVFVARHATKAFGLLIANSLLLLALMTVYLAFRRWVPSNTWLLIALMVSVQQLAMFARAGLRVALVAGELDLYRRLRPSLAVLIPPEPPSEIVSPVPEPAPASPDPIVLAPDTTLTEP